MAVDGAHLYWANLVDGTIGRADLDGTGLTRASSATPSSPAGWRSTERTSIGPTASAARSGAPASTARGQTRPSSTAPAPRAGWRSTRRISTGPTAATAIGRAGLDGTGVNQGFIAGASGPAGRGRRAHPNDLPRRPLPRRPRFRRTSSPSARPKLNEKKGIARLPATVPGPGELALSGNGVKAAGAVVAKAVTAPGAVQLLIKATGKKQRKLNETGKVTVKPRVTYTPTGGDPSARSRKVKLKKL